jgi:hypothetical protein
MKGFARFTAALAAVALVILGASATSSLADYSHWVEKPLKLQKTAGGAIQDTITIIGVADTARTSSIDMGDWDTTPMLSTGVAAHQQPYAYLNIVVTSGATVASPASTDSIYFTVEKMIGSGVGGQAFSKNRTIAASVGALALTQDGSSTPAVFFTAPLFLGNDRLIPALNDLGGCKSFRIRWGRTSATVPFQIKASIVYPKKDSGY